jgi:hypothetical protein
LWRDNEDDEAAVELRVRMLVDEALIRCDKDDDEVDGIKGAADRGTVTLDDDDEDDESVALAYDRVTVEAAAVSASPARPRGRRAPSECVLHLASRATSAGESRSSQAVLRGAGKPFKSTRTRRRALEN